MARITVFIPDDVLFDAERHYLKVVTPTRASVNRSDMVAKALAVWSATAARRDVSERGRLETLRAVRAAQAALGDVEGTLTQARPVKRRVRRYPASRPTGRGT